MIWVAIVVWAVLAGALAIGGVHWATGVEHKKRMQAYRDILREKGVEPVAGETIKGALLRARREEQGIPSVRPPPVFAKTVLDRPKSSPDWTVEGRSTGHVGGHTAASIESMKAVVQPPRPSPRPATLTFPTASVPRSSK